MMKVNFIVAGIPVKNAYAKGDFAQKMPQVKNSFASSADVFVKSAPAFKGVKSRLS